MKCTFLNYIFYLLIIQFNVFAGYSVWAQMGILKYLPWMDEWVTGIDYICSKPTDRSFLSLTDPVIYSKKQSPWIAHIFDQKDKDKKYKCSGTLITNYLVLTAAHCLFTQGVKDEPQNLGVTLDMVHPPYVNESKFYNAQPIGTYFLHPNSTGSFNDPINLAIVLLRFPVISGPICMWPSDKYYNITKGFMVGWEQLDREISEQKYMKLSWLQIRPQDKCDESNNGSNNKFCADEIHSKENCFGYPGNGLIVQDDNDNFFLKGVLSKMVCGSSQYGVFTDVTMFYDWFMDVENKTIDSF